MIDWRGNHYDVGSTVLYPRAVGHSIEMTEATVLDLKVLVRDVDIHESWMDWDKRLGITKFNGTQHTGSSYSYTRKPTPEYQAWLDDKAARQEANPRLKWVEQVEDVKVKLQPMKSSRFNYGQAEQQRFYASGQKPVTLTIVKNITAI